MDDESVVMKNDTLGQMGVQPPPAEQFPRNPQRGPSIDPAFDFDVINARIGVLETEHNEISERYRLFKLDSDSTRNMVLNLLQRCEPRISLIEETLIEVGLLMRNEKGEIVKSPKQSKEVPPSPNKLRRKRHVTRNVTSVTRKKRK